MVSEHCGIRLPNVVENGDRKLLYMAAEPLWYMAIQLCGVCPPNNCGICLWDLCDIRLSNIVAYGYLTMWYMATNNGTLLPDHCGFQLPNYCGIW